MTEESREQEATVKEARVLLGKRIRPINSKRLTALHLEQLAGAMGIPTTWTTEQLWQVVTAEPVTRQ